MRQNRQMEMLNLVLQDELLRKNYDVDISDISSIDQARLCGKPIVEAVALIVREINDIPNDEKKSELYNEIFNNLKNNLLNED